MDDDGIVMAFESSGLGEGSNYCVPTVRAGDQILRIRLSLGAKVQ